MKWNLVLEVHRRSSTRNCIFDILVLFTSHWHYVTQVHVQTYEHIIHQFCYSSILLSIHPFLYPSTHYVIHPLWYPSIHYVIHPFCYPPILLSIRPSIHPPAHSNDPLIHPLNAYLSNDSKLNSIDVEFQSRKGIFNKTEGRKEERRK